MTQLESTRMNAPTRTAIEIKFFLGNQEVSAWYQAETAWYQAETALYLAQASFPAETWIKTFTKKWLRKSGRKFKSCFPEYDFYGKIEGYN